MARARRPYLSVSLASIVLLAGAPCAVRADERASAEAGDWTVRGALDGGGHGARGYAVSLDYGRDGALVFGSLGGTRTDGEDADGRVVASTGASATLGIGNDFTRARVGVASSVDADVRRSLQWRASVALGPPVFGVTFAYARRHTDFDDFPAAATATLRSGRRIAIDAVAACELDDASIGLELASAARAWAGYLSTEHSRFADARCAFSGANVAGGSGRERLDRSRLRRVAGDRLTALGPRAAGRIGFTDSLYEDVYATGVSRRGQVLTVALDYTRARDYATRAWQQNAQFTLSFPLGERFGVDLGAGSTFGGGASAAYASIGASASF